MGLQFIWGFVILNYQGRCSITNLHKKEPRKVITLHFSLGWRPMNILPIWLCPSCLLASIAQWLCHKSGAIFQNDAINWRPAIAFIISSILKECAIGYSFALADGVIIGVERGKASGIIRDTPKADGTCPVPMQRRYASDSIEPKWKIFGRVTSVRIASMRVPWLQIFKKYIGIGGE
jgi:hypothetical protein